MTKTYSTPSTARRALKNVLAKAGVELEAVTHEIRTEDGQSMNIVEYSETLADVDMEQLAGVAKVTHPAQDDKLDAAIEESVENARPSNRYVRERSKIEDPCAMVHDIASGMFAENPQVTRKEVVEACRRRGIAYGTARTQYQKWFAAHQQKG